MNFYAYIHILSYVFTFIELRNCSSNTDLRVLESGLKDPSPYSVGLQFFVKLNNTSDAVDYSVELAPDQCCLESGISLDCDILEIIGGCSQNVLRGDARTFNLIAPILDPYERKGYCIAYIDSKRTDKKRHAMRDTVKIHFDTRVKNTNGLPGLKKCKRIDEDPLNDCRPVDCEVFYNGRRSHFSRIRNRCVEIPKCINDGIEAINVFYNPEANICVRDDPISEEDVEYIKNLVHGKDRVVKDIVIIKKFRDEDNETDMNAFDRIEPDYRKYKTDKEQHLMRVDEPKSLKKAALCYLCKNKAGLSFLGIVVLIQCVLIFLMVYCMSKNCFCKRKQVLEKKFFNYRNDASVTTPLIGTTNMETETTCQFMSESSNIDKKIQCYKACQKENAKVSMSDDILSKCLNRRNWDRKQAKSDAIGLSKSKDAVTKEMKSDDSNAKYETHFVSTKTQEAKVNFENEKGRAEKKRMKSTVKSHHSKKEVFKDTDETGDSEFASSEQEIKCHTYNSKYNTESKEMMGSVNALSEREIKCHSYNYMDDGSDIYAREMKSKSQLAYKSEGKRKVPTDKGQASAQASFSNDSIDDFLSERGVMFLAAENTSKYSLSNESGLKSTSSVSSKTSKNNIVKNVLSYLKRSKHGPSSDPGVKKSKEKINLELIHMSRGSMYSSSNNETDCLKNITRLKDSRTSL